MLNAEPMKRPNNFLVNNVIDSMDDNSKGTILRSMAIFSTIELCGSILNGRTAQGTSEQNFMTFCNSNYMPRKYTQVSELLYKSFRCGVAHSYVAKGGALLSSDPKERRKHLKAFSNGLLIYVPTLATDVSAAVRKLYSDIRSKASMEAKYKRVLGKLDTDGLDAYSKYLFRYNVKPINTRIERDIVVDID